MAWSHNSKNKFHAQKIEVGGEKYDSKKEYRRHQELMLLERVGEISNLQRQVRIELIPTQREPDTVGRRGGVIKGKVIEHSCSYVADFVYEENGVTVYEDVKSPATRTKEYIIKRKLLLFLKGIRLKET